MGNWLSSENEPSVFFRTSPNVPLGSDSNISSTRPILHKRSFFKVYCSHSSMPYHGLLGRNKKFMLLKEDEIEAFKGIHQTTSSLDGRIDQVLAEIRDLRADNAKIVNELANHSNEIRKIRYDIDDLQSKIGT